MKVYYDRPASRELIDAAKYYERQQTGLGRRFRSAIQQCIRQICQNPMAGAPYEEETRRWLSPQVPYAIVYLFEQEAIRILAIAHTRQEPLYWKGRRGDV